MAGCNGPSERAARIVGVGIDAGIVDPTHIRRRTMVVTGATLAGIVPSSGSGVGQHAAALDSRDGGPRWNDADRGPSAGRESGGVVGGFWVEWPTEDLRVNGSEPIGTHWIAMRKCFRVADRLRRRTEIAGRRIVGGLGPGFVTQVTLSGTITNPSEFLFADVTPCEHFFQV